MQLPSNKVGLVLIVVVLIVAGIITGNIFSDELGYKGSESDDSATAIVVERRTTAHNSIDQDGDGLFAWQEELYGSDPNNFDTDGDGTNDGDEIAEGRDPTVAGPDDGLSTYKDLFNTEVNLKNYVQGSLTDNLSVELFANYLDLRQLNALSQENQQILVENIAAKADSSTDISNQFSINDITLIESNNETLKAYGNSFAKTYVLYGNKLGSIEGPDDLDYIKNVGAGYIEFANGMRELQVPNVAGNVHLEIVNRIYNAGVLISSFADNYEIDPLKSLFAIQNIKINAQNDFALYNSLAVYFRDNGIIFGDNETIRFWNYFEQQ